MKLTIIVRQEEEFDLLKRVYLHKYPKDSIRFLFPHLCLIEPDDEYSTNQSLGYAQPNIEWHCTVLVVEQSDKYPLRPLCLFSNEMRTRTGRRSILKCLLVRVWSQEMEKQDPDNHTIELFSSRIWFANVWYDLVFGLHSQLFDHLTN